MDERWEMGQEVKITTLPVILVIWFFIILNWSDIIFFFYFRGVEYPKIALGILYFATKFKKLIIPTKWQSLKKLHENLPWVFHFTDEIEHGH